MRVMGSVFAAMLTAAAALSATPDGAPVNPVSKPPAAPIKPVTETLWGRKVTDNYRYMEAEDSETIDWIKAQGAYTRSLLDGIKPLATLKESVARFSASFGLTQGYVSFGGRAFYEERRPGSDNFDLIAADRMGTRKLVDVAALRRANGDVPLAINYFLVSPDGQQVAVGISEGGSEDASLSVYDAATGTKIAGPLDRVQFGATAWSPDSRLLYFVRLKKSKATDAPEDKYLNQTADVWDLKSEPQALLGASTGHGPSFTPTEVPAIVLGVDSPVAGAFAINGVQNEITLWLTPMAQVNDPKAVWTPFITRDDEITSMDLRGSEIFLLSHKDTPTFKVLAVKAGDPLGSATVLVPGSPTRVIDGIHAASDALYVLMHQGAYSELLRIPAGTREVQKIPLPIEGHVDEAFTDPRTAGVVLSLSSWVVPTTTYRYDPEAKFFVDLKVGALGDIAGSDFTVSDLQAKTPDGVKVPLTLIQPKAAKRAQITLIEAYGSYGISEFADFSVRRAAALKQGITYALCHVRGGGELGESWRLDGKDEDKHHTWEDLITCGESLIKRGITRSDKLFILGGSAGGITMGRAMTRRPELFAGVIDLVPGANTLRDEFSPSGPPNIPEFGSITTREGFRNLYDMDSIRHVKKGVHYPAVLITTGLNDPRVPSWEPAKFAAALQDSGSANPVLLRVDADAGHGIGSTKTQTDALTADCIAFVLWRSGLSEWQPVVGFSSAPQ